MPQGIVYLYRAYISILSLPSPSNSFPTSFPMFFFSSSKEEKVEKMENHFSISDRVPPFEILRVKGTHQSRSHLPHTFISNMLSPCYSSHVSFT